MQTISVLLQKLQNSRERQEKGNCVLSLSWQFLFFVFPESNKPPFSLFLFRFFLTRSHSGHIPGSLMSLPYTRHATCLCNMAHFHPFKSLHKCHPLARPSLSLPQTWEIPGALSYFSVYHLVLPYGYFTYFTYL